MKTKQLIITVLSLAVIGLIAIALILAMNGNTKTTGNYPADIEGESLACESHSVKYPIFAHNDAKSRDLKITATFYNKKFNAISLAYTLYYDTEEQIKNSEAKNHASMNISFGEDGLGSDAFDINYAKMDDALKTVLYTGENNFNTTTAKYFMVDAKEKKDLPNTINEFQKIYKSQGFSCNVSKK